MMPKPILFSVLFALFVSSALQAQILINEASNRNNITVSDDDDNTPDWIELYNAGSLPVNLSGYYLTDDPALPNKWAFPSMDMQAGEFMLVFASGKNRVNSIDHWAAAVKDTSVWKYRIPSAQLPSNWNTIWYNPVGWSSGMASIGMGDGDDATPVPAGTISVYMRYIFNIADLTKISAAVFHVDYDDGFVAYLNGTEIARAGLSGQPPAWNELAPNHEAVMYSGGMPSAYVLTPAQLGSLLVQGQNILAVEVHNTSASSTDLTIKPFLHFGITDNTPMFASPASWFNLPAGRYIHSNFKISSEGELVQLYQGQSLADQLMVSVYEADYSTGSVIDGSQQRGIFLTPTPGQSNNSSASFQGFVPAPMISLPAGEYPSAVQVELGGASPVYTIRYTTDGQVPTLSSPVYTSPINITSTTVLKARAWGNPSQLPSHVATASYLINEPSTLPILSVSAQTADLWGPNGIFDNWSLDWEKPCVAEYFDQSGQRQFCVRSGIQMDGGAGGSRSRPQKSFRLDFEHNIYGDGDVDYPLIPDRAGRDDYAAIYLRNGSNYWMNMTWKDATLTRANRNTKCQYAAYTPVSVYINGAYWGVYEIREKLDADYYRRNYGASPDSIDILSRSYWYNQELRAVEGSDTGFYNTYNCMMALNPLDSSYFGIVNQRIALYDFADYLCAEIWNSNTDWLFNNMRLWRSPAVDNRWRFGLIDQELGLAGWSNETNDMFTFIQNYDVNNPFARIVRSVLQNPQFRAYMFNRFADLMNTEYLPSRILPMADSIRNEFVPEMPANYVRWGSSSSHTTYTAYYNATISKHNQTVQQMSVRSAYVREDIVQHHGYAGQVSLTLDVSPAGAGKVKINTITPGPNPWTGKYFNGLPVTVTAIANPGFQFSHWLTNPFILDPQLSSFTRNITANSTFTAVFDTLYYNPLITIGEINYHPHASMNDGEWFEIYNYDTLAADMSSWIFSDADSSHKLIFNQGTIIQPGARLVVCNDTAAFRHLHPSVPFYNGQFDFNLGNKSDSLLIRTPLKTTYLSVFYNDTLPWPTGADGGGRTLELTSQTSPLNDPLNWFAGCMGGSPGTPWYPCQEEIVFGEINYNSNEYIDTYDWVEILNNTQDTLDIGGWRFSDSQDSNVFVLPAPLLLASGERWLLVQNTTAFQIIHPSVQNFSGPFGFGLSGSGERLRLFDAQGILRFSVDYSDLPPWPAGADGNGYTLELSDPAADMCSGYNWFAGCPGGSPGKAYHPSCYPVVYNPLLTLSEINYHPGDGMNDGEWIELWNYSATDTVELSGWYVSDADTLDKFHLPFGSFLAPGERMVLCENPQGFAAAHPSVYNYAGPLPFGLNNKCDTLLIYSPARTVFERVVYTDSLPWPEGADGGGRTLERTSPADPADQPSSWFDGCMGGSPGTAWNPCSEDILITEINYNSDVNLDSDDWVEIKNNSSQTLHLAGWRFGDDNDSNAFHIPYGTYLNPGEYLVLVQNVQKFLSIHPAVSNYSGPFGFNLSGSGEGIRLFDAYGRIVYSVRYDDTPPWPEDADGDGYTLELLDESLPPNSGSNWFAGCPGGSPGTFYTTPCDSSSALSENYPLVSGIFPNPVASAATLYIHSSGQQQLSIELKDAAGRLVRKFSPPALSAGENKISLSFDGISPGVYYAEITAGGSKWVNKVIKR